MVYIKLFQTEQEKQACTDKYKYLVYTEENKKVSIHQEEPFFCKLTLNNGEIVYIEGSGRLESAQTVEYSATTIKLESGDLCNSFYPLGKSLPSLTSVIIGNGFQNITSNVFSGLTSLLSVIIGNNVKQIASQCFKGCIALSSVTLGNSVTDILDYSFQNCKALSSITIPNSVTNLQRCFYNCTNLSNIKSLASIAPTLTSKPFNGISANGTLYVPQGSSGYDTWLTALGSGWTKVEQ